MSIVAPQDNQNSITDFLQAPKKKKKNFIVIATESTFNPEISSVLKSKTKTITGNFSFSFPKTIKELLKQINRNISLLIISDQFAKLDEVLETIKKLKVKRHQFGLPVLFLTVDYNRLIEGYHNILLSYHETDEYIYLPSFKESILQSRINYCLNLENARKGKRYAVNEKISFYYLQQDKIIFGTLKDLSLFGALIVADEKYLFNEKDQLRINISSAAHLGYSHGEYLKISAKVRRVYISGNTIAVSFEYLSETKVNQLTLILTSIVNKTIKQIT